MAKISVDDIINEENQEYHSQKRQENTVFQQELERTIRGFYFKDRYLIEKFPKINEQFKYWLNDYDQLGEIPASDILDTLKTCFEHLIEIKNKIAELDLEELAPKTLNYYLVLKGQIQNEMLYYDTSKKLDLLHDVMSRNTKEVNEINFSIASEINNKQIAEEKERKRIEAERKKEQDEDERNRIAEENERIRVKNLLKTKLGIKGSYSHSTINLGSGEELYLKTFFSTLRDDWCSSLGIVNTAHFDKGMLMNLLMKRDLRIDNLLQIKADYLFENSNEIYGIEANNRNNLPINFFSSLERLTINNSNLDFLPYVRLPKLKKLTLNSCFYGFQVIGTQLTRNINTINIDDDILHFFKLNHLDCKIEINH